MVINRGRLNLDILAFAEPLELAIEYLSVPDLIALVKDSDLAGLVVLPSDYLDDFNDQIDLVTYSFGRMQLFKFFKRNYTGRVQDSGLSEDLSDPVAQGLQKLLLQRFHCRIILPEELHGNELSHRFDILLFLIGHEAKTSFIISKGKFRARGKQGPRRVKVEVSSEVFGTSKFRDCSTMDTDDVPNPLRNRKVLKLGREQYKSTGLNVSFIRDRLVLIDHPQSASVSIR